MEPKSILDEKNLAGKKVLVRVDWNVPLQSGKVVDDYRIKQSLATIDFLLNEGAKVIIICHLETVESLSLKPIAEHLYGRLPLTFCDELLGDKATDAVNKLEGGKALLLENLRLDEREKSNDDEFAKALSEHGDIFVNEAFSASHRNHSSIVGIPKYLPSTLGTRFMEEMKELSKAFYPKKPFLFILGGAKFDTKIPLIEKFIHIADTIFVGGALAHNFFKEQGKLVGKSLISEGDFHLKEKLDTGKVMLPVDACILSAGHIRIDNIDKVRAEDSIVDAGSETLLMLKEKINESSVILWNGPMGNYEKGYKQGTLELAKALSESGKETIMGGGDTLAAIQELGIFDKFTFVSTGGGAMLDFLATGTLPGIEAIKKQQKV
ncbi:MAG: phosphoglycerate kinase [bacterium]|nr:phosphoglycerate kinase [bacterium]